MGFFDEIVEGVSREFARVQSRSQEMMQTYNLNSQIRTLEGKKTAAFIEIGKLVFEKYQRNGTVTEEQLKEKTDEIVSYEHEITVLKAEMDALQAQSDPNTSASQKADFKAGYTPTPGFTCPHCHAPANVDKAFCPACGGSVTSPPDGGGNGGES